ncbi:glycosyltransferase family 4 protein [Brumimicrobium mesophilum]|uniref:glycosyltransferase family 4 protein n=1 Tax=Brumimicrobium mesophilum TaxID=392717 RepID=UPI000D141532|nr:glycosyltransferase family 4 protein [Brumimicrobium mesophilum]
MKSDKKVLFLASWYPSDENSTLGNFVQKHAELANEIAYVDVLYAVNSNAVKRITVVDEVINNLRTVIVYYPTVKSELPGLSSVIKRNSFLNALREGFKYLNSKYDLVHLNAVFPAGIFARWLKKKHHIPYVVTVHWTGFLECHNVYSSLPFYLKNTFKRIFNAAQQVFPVSDHLGKALINLGLTEEYSVLNNVVKSKYFYPEKKKSNSNSIPRFLHISTFDDSHKNVTGMLRVFSKLKIDFQLHIITEGDELDVWKVITFFNIPHEKCIVESKLKVEEIGEAMRKSDCFVLFSNYETFSIVLAEAWMSGLPVIYSQCGGLTEITNSNIGIQIKSKDEVGLLKALENFNVSKYNPDLISDFSNQFSEGAIKKQLDKVYRTF